MVTRGGAGNMRKRPLPNIVPSNLVSYIQGTEPQDMSLRDCNNNVWHLKMEKFGENWYFTDGWVEFVKDNMIKGGDVLFYQYSSQGLIDFRVLSSSGSENDGIEPLTTRRQDEIVEVKTEEGLDFKVLGSSGSENDEIEPLTTRRHDAIVEVRTEEEEAADGIHNKPPKKRYNGPPKEKVGDAGASGRKRGKKRTYQDYYGAEVFSSGEVCPPTNPYFVTRTRETRVNEMYIPADVVKCNDLQLPEVMVLVDSEGRKFRTMRTSWKDRRVIYCGGWKALCKVNLAGKDDKLICEFVHGEEGDLQIKVTFIRAK